MRRLIQYQISKMRYWKKFSYLEIIQSVNRSNTWPKRDWKSQVSNAGSLVYVLSVLTTAPLSRYLGASERLYELVAR